MDAATSTRSVWLAAYCSRAPLQAASSARGVLSLTASALLRTLRGVTGLQASVALCLALAALTVAAAGAGTLALLGAAR
jgi:hypothetical protein